VVVGLPSIGRSAETLGAAEEPPANGTSSLAPPLRLSVAPPAKRFPRSVPPPNGSGPAEHKSAEPA
jgi:hypothetical protein